MEETPLPRKRSQNSTTASVSTGCGSFAVKISDPEYFKFCCAAMVVPARRLRRCQP